MRYKDCIFDLYGTLVDIHTDEDHPAVWEQTAGEFSCRGADYAPDELRAAYLRLVGEAERDAVPLRRDSHEAHPEIQIEPVFQQLFAEKGVSVSLEEAAQAGRAFRRFSTEYIKLYDGVKELLRALRQSGQGVWLLSNAQGCFTRMELDDLGLTPLFDGVCLSSDYRCKKPDRRFFDALLDRYSIDPATAVMVGNDGVCDIGGAKGAGLNALYIRSNLSPEEPVPPADYSLDGVDMAAVRAILQQE